MKYDGVLAKNKTRNDDEFNKIHPNFWGIVGGFVWYFSYV
ncbi:hypothetical protein YPC_1482 [Yersinia pestis biovar Medievalis str. Harbin 35]|nr:hypothetical protein YPC_1482 [Yersinia pestis biovar Medievalis str. Harbin 35]EEO76284.1 hypothetical protein YP516_2481 [Yersinia pestis Nepal516]EEO80482.1 hypothetical protein YPF_3305 [Yersinia pestis biovar Orientalis str. India 195]EEO89661.1 hypothetical protein YPS_3112 [Yersinia pestis Pestoides A]